MPFRYQARRDTTDRVPTYFNENRLYPRVYTRSTWPTRVSRRNHEGLSIDRNYGLDTTSDDVDSSPYSSPYYINGRYNSSNLTTQRGNSASVQGVKKLLILGEEVERKNRDQIYTTIPLWQGKQIRFSMTQKGKLIGHTVELKNTDGCTGILSFYFSYSPNGKIIAETAVNLCEVSQEEFEERSLYMMTPIPQGLKGSNTIYVRMEIWDEISCERTENPFNTGRKIEVKATGLNSHEEWVYTLGEKNVPVEETPNYTPLPNCPYLRAIYNPWDSIPTNRIEGVDRGARVSKDGYDYDIFCIKNGTEAKVVIYDKRTNSTIPNTFPIDSRATSLNLVQAEDKVYYVDGYSPLQRFTIGTWDYYEFPTSSTEEVSVTINLDVWAASSLGNASGFYLFSYRNGGWTYKGEPATLSDYGITLNGVAVEGAELTVNYVKATSSTVADISVNYTDSRPVVGASIILKHNNRIYLSGFRYDPNLIQLTRITTEGPDFDSYAYRFYAPNESPLSTSTNIITAIVEYQSDTLMIAFQHGYSLYTSNVDLENAIPQQVSSYSDGAGVASQGDITCYRGTVYSFDPDEGIRRFTGALWTRLGGMHIDNLFERVDMNKPRKLWGYAYKLYFNYTDRVDGKAKCIIWDMTMNWEQFPYFQDSDLPFCDVRYNDDFELIGIHPDYPCIMQLYHENTWRRLDTPITFERHTKFISLPGNAANMILRRVHNKVIANSNRWWWLGLSFDTPTLEQHRGNDSWYRMPCWDTITEEQPVESPFPQQEEYEEKSIALLTIPALEAENISVQLKVKAKTFRDQANLISTVFEAGARNYN